MTKKADRTLSHGRQGKVPADLKTLSKAAIRSRKYRLAAENYRLKQFNLMAPADQDSRELLREVAVHLSTLTDEMASERRLQIRAILSSPAAHEPLLIAGASVARVAEQNQQHVVTPARAIDPIAEALRRELNGRQDAWPLLLKILKNDQLLADVCLTAKRPDGIDFLRKLLRDRPAQIAAMKASRDPAVVDLGLRIKGGQGLMMLAIRLLLSLEQSLRGLGRKTTINRLRHRLLLRARI